MGGKIYAFTDVVKHNKTKDCWLIMHGKKKSLCFGWSVYDVTPFTDEHPGGDEVWFAATGKDATSDFEDIGHSNDARKMMDQYCIGEIDVSSKPTRLSYNRSQGSSYNPDKTTDFLIKILQLTVPLMILALAFSVRYYTKSE